MVRKWSKRGTWAWADLLYWFFYLPMTAAVIITLVIVPARLLNASVQPMPLDAALFEERVFQHLAEYSPVTGVDKTKLTDDVVSSTRFSLSQKRFGYEIKIGDKTIYGRQQFYDIAKPLAPVRYDKFTAKKTIQNTPIEITQLYPQKYEKIT